MAANTFFLPFRPVFDGSGMTVPGAQIYFTLTGGNTPSAPYAESSLTTPLANPVVADGVGAFPPIFTNDAVTYRVRVYSRDAEVGVDTPLEEYDPWRPWMPIYSGSSSAYIVLDPTGTFWNVVIANTSVAQFSAQMLTLLKPVKHPTVTTSQLPAAATRAGTEYYVSDANATTRLSSVVGGGSNFVKVFSNGTNWLIQ